MERKSSFGSSGGVGGGGDGRGHDGYANGGAELQIRRWWGGASGSGPNGSAYAGGAAVRVLL